MKRTTLILLLTLLSQLALAAEPPLTRIAFGSCAHQDDEQPIWRAVNQDRPDLFIFLGDNVYADTEDPDELKAAYAKLGNKPGFRQLQEHSRVLATWDDHDYGENDAGVEFAPKEASRQIMLDFWGEPANSARRQRETGIYTSYFFGPPGQRVQVILLDLRWNRTPLNSVPAKVYKQEKEPRNMGPYEPVDHPEAELLGEDQWQWLEKQLQLPADLRIIGSSIQLLSEFTGWESWANFPRERQRLFDLIERHKVAGVFIISGDTHWAEFTRLDDAVDYPLWELTSSGLTQEWKNVSPNQHRLGSAAHEHNYGLLEINWQSAQPFITASIKNEEGRVLLQNTLRLRDLSVQHSGK